MKFTIKNTKQKLKLLIKIMYLEQFFIFLLF